MLALHSVRLGGKAMSTTKFGLAAVVCCTAVVASGGYAQDRRAQRRERLRDAAEAAAGIAERVADAAERADVVSGNVVLLRATRGNETKEVNNGGLVVVRVSDFGGRAPQDIIVDGGQQFQRLGQVRGVREQDGRPLAGGGYTWILLKPINEGEGTIILSYTPNDGGIPVTREFKVNVTAAEADDTAN
jgi:hypothetical protein